MLMLEDENKIKFPIANNKKKIQLDKMKNPFGAFGVHKEKRKKKLIFYLRKIFWQLSIQES